MAALPDVFPMCPGSPISGDHVFTRWACNGSPLGLVDQPRSSHPPVRSFTLGVHLEEF